MATVFKRTLANGKKARDWTIQYMGPDGIKKQCKGFSDKQESERLAFKLEEEARRRRSGLIDRNVEILEKHANQPIQAHLDAYLDSIRAKSRTDKHVRLTKSRIEAVLAQGQIGKLEELTHERVEQAILGLQSTKKLGLRTVNHYILSLKEFAAWLVPERLPASSLARLEVRNAAVDVRKKRRALTGEEISRLVDAARASSKSVQGYDGEQRARIYLLSYMTGLRQGEIASLTPQSFNLNDATPTYTVEAQHSKHRKKDVIALHPLLAELLKAWLPDYPSDQPLFPKLAKRKGFRMVREDLAAAGIPFRTSDGDADFHAVGRHTFITELMRNGTSIVVARELARHSDINTTMRYTHIRLADQARGIENLPADPVWTKNKELRASDSQQIRSNSQQIRSKFGGSSGQFESPDGPGSHQLTENSIDISCSEESPCVTSMQQKAPSVTEGANMEAAGMTLRFHLFF
jgi:integrase/recombinase XerC